MFTGLIEQTAVIAYISKRRNAHRLTVKTEKDPHPVKAGDSISVSGACLTVVGIKKNFLTFDVVDETFKATSLGSLKKNDFVNIEKSLEQKSRIDGHFVLGHVDTVRKIKSIEKNKNPYMDISIAPSEGIYVVKKGSIAVDGISLTVGNIYDEVIRLYIIPYTLRNTNLKYKKKDEAVNLEFDILGKYAERMAPYRKVRPSLVTEALLKDKGFI